MKGQFGRYIYLTFQWRGLCQCVLKEVLHVELTQVMRIFHAKETSVFCVTLDSLVN